MEQFNDGGYSVNYAEVLKSKDVMAVTKLLATRLMNNPYMAVGDFLQSLSDDDLNTLNQKNECDDPEYSDAILIAEMLATAEGLEASTDFDGFHKRLSALAGFLIIESLKRKGFVKIYYENVSFGEELGDKIVVEKI